jgi:hypothetical protein
VAAAAVDEPCTVLAGIDELVGTRRGCAQVPRQRVSDHFEHDRADVLAFTVFSEGSLRQIWPNNQRATQGREGTVFLDWAGAPHALNAAHGLPARALRWPRPRAAAPNTARILCSSTLSW